MVSIQSFAHSVASNLLIEPIDKEFKRSAIVECELCGKVGEARLEAQALDDNSGAFLLITPCECFGDVDGRFKSQYEAAKLLEGLTSRPRLNT